MDKTVPCFIAALVLVALSDGSAWAAYQQNWDADAGQWQYWVSPGDEPGVEHHAQGGVADSGHISVNLADVGWQGPLDPPINYLYWTAYYYNQDSGPGPMDFTGADISVYACGENVELQNGELYFYLGRFNADLSQYAQYRTQTPVSIGQGNWQLNAWTLSTDAADWQRISGNAFTFADVVSHAGEFGFVITGVPTGPDPSGVIKLDEFDTDAVLVPAPATLGLLAAAGTMAWRRRRP